MAREKTYLSPKQQCVNTLELAIDWCERYTPFVRLKPEDYTVDWHQQNELLEEIIQETPNLKYKKSFIELVEHTS